MNSNSKLRFLDETQLKLIALISMLTDHVGFVFFPSVTWMRAVGRIAMPIFALCVSEGYYYSKNRNKYLIRIGIFALISEIPFDLCFRSTIDLKHQNVMVSFFLAVCALVLFDAFCNISENELVNTAVSIVPVLFAAVLARGLRSDYSYIAVISVYIFYITRRLPYPVSVLSGIGFISMIRIKGIYAYTGLAGIPVLMYNGKRGKGLKYLFYVFYPLHLLILYFIRIIFE